MHPASVHRESRSRPPAFPQVRGLRFFPASSQVECRHLSEYSPDANDPFSKPGKPSKPGRTFRLLLVTVNGRALVPERRVADGVVLGAALAELVHPRLGALAVPAEPGLVEARERVGALGGGEGLGAVVAGEGLVAGLAAVFAVAGPAVARFEDAAAGVVAEAFAGYGRPFGFAEFAERRGELAGVLTPRHRWTTWPWLPRGRSATACGRPPRRASAVRVTGRAIRRRGPLPSIRRAAGGRLAGRSSLPR